LFLTSKKDLLQN